MKILVTGSAGLIGRQVVKDLIELNHTVHASYYHTKPEFGEPIKMDLTNQTDIEKTCQTIKPDTIIHLGALTNVDLCEQERDLAVKINTKATEIISKQATKEGSFLVYVSTDYVFDGKSGMKKETDLPNPIDFYGESKLRGEKAIMDFTSSWCIARTSTPFGLHPTRKSFPLWIIENLLAKKEIFIVTDQYTSPTYVSNLSQMIIEIAIRKINGIIHVAGATRISRYKMAELIADMINLDKMLLKPTSITEMKWVAKRPKDSSLDVSKATSILKEKPLEIKQSLQLFMQEIKPYLNII